MLGLARQFGGRDQHPARRLPRLLRRAGYAGDRGRHRLGAGGGLGDVAGALPQALRAAGVDVRVLTPYYPALRAAFPSAVEIAAPDGFGGSAAQLWIQVQGILYVLIYDAIATFVILKVLDVIMGIRTSEEAERDGLDLALHGETLQ